MKPGVKSDVAKSTKQIAKKVARQAVQEPLEVLKSAGKQVKATEIPAGPLPEQRVSPQQVPGEVSEVEKKRIEAQGKRQLEKLEREIEEIRKKKKLEEKRKEPEKPEEPKKPLVEPQTRKPRKVVGWSKKLKDIRRRAEIRRPPSG
jgi:hypothetical protein